MLPQNLHIIMTMKTIANPWNVIAYKMHFQWHYFQYQPYSASECLKLQQAMQLWMVLVLTYRQLLATNCAACKKINPCTGLLSFLRRCHHTFLNCFKDVVYQLCFEIVVADSDDLLYNIGPMTRTPHPVTIVNHCLRASSASASLPSLFCSWNVPCCLWRNVYLSWSFVCCCIMYISAFKLSPPVCDEWC
jgi:hypothetical protein